MNALSESVMIAYSANQNKMTDAPRTLVVRWWDVTRLYSPVLIPRRLQAEASERYTVRGDEVTMIAKDASVVDSCLRPTDSSVERSVE